MALCARFVMEQKGLWFEEFAIVQNAGEPENLSIESVEAAMALGESR